MLSFLILLQAVPGTPPVFEPLPPAIVTVPRPISPDAKSCAMLNAVNASIQAELPKMVDAATRLDGSVVFCGLRSWTVSKFVNVDMGMMREGWRARKQEQWNQINCSNEAFAPMLKRGWRFAQVLTFRSGERVTLDATCG